MERFDCSLWHDISIKDLEQMRAAQKVSNFPSCEYACANLLMWAGSFGTRVAFYRGRAYYHMAKIDEFLFPAGCGEDPETCRMLSAGELFEVCCMIKQCGFSGKVGHVPAWYLAAGDVTKYFEVIPMDDGNDEYIYETASLAELHGSKLAKKRNLISQFERIYPNYKILQLSESRDFCDVQYLSSLWQKDHETTAFASGEPAAIEFAMDHFNELGLEGLVLMTDEGAKAYAIFSPVNQDSCTVHFEKALPECKGAAQVINQATAKFLLGKYRYINREQDLGLPGLRQAKLSYMPCKLLKDYTLIPRSFITA
ncbi:MAG: DUF2156 domain-containing protein [Lentisphaeria bacterium]|nr:DUF2156 domain-containing protein [Lentisphaeria bacterium]